MPMFLTLQVLKEQEGSISIKDLSTATMIKTDDIISTLNHLNLIQYQKGQHVICAAPAVIEKHIKEAGSPGLQVLLRLSFLLPALHELRAGCEHGCSDTSTTE